MCGIFGVTLRPGVGPPPGPVAQILKDLLKSSERRGKDASGIAVFRGEEAKVLRSSRRATRLVKDRAFRDFLSKIQPAPSKVWSAIGHCRLATDGSADRACNNQPLETGDSYLVHNGIIVNDDLIWRRYPGIEKTTESDSELFLRLFDFFSHDRTLPQALQSVFSEIEGTASVVILSKTHKKLLLATNHGSLYYRMERNPERLIFASERAFLERLDGSPSGISHLQANQALSLCLETFHREEIDLPPPQRYRSTSESGKSGFAFRNAMMSGKSRDLDGLFVYPDNSQLKRCSRCVLPATMPFIEFEEQGVCNYCLHYQRHRLEGREALLKILDRHRRGSGEPDVIVAFSGGRDSSYGLHLLKKEFGMTPLAFSYDWGVLTDIARRNQARMCAQLGVEQVVISADLPKKRANIRKNIQAWMRAPDIGMIPLFMAGDKQFFYYANRLKKENGIPLLVFCMNLLERVDFKAAFAGINNVGYKAKIFEEKRFVTVSRVNSLKLGLYYLGRFLLNPRYLNRSLLDSFWGYLCYYFLPHDHLSLYEYVPWNEAEIEGVLHREYDWEASNVVSGHTWRIGDGTAAFYNYIYRTVCGFTEHDGLRSNQIREGQISREEALKRLQEENQPRQEAVLQYLHMVHLDPREVLQTINSVSRMY